jgi:hypothetical protein
MGQQHRYDAEVHGHEHAHDPLSQRRPGLDAPDRHPPAPAQPCGPGRPGSPDFSEPPGRRGTSHSHEPYEDLAKKHGRDAHVHDHERRPAHRYCPLQTASEGFSDSPRALGIPIPTWGIGGTDPALHQQAEAAGRLSQDVPVNHSAHFAPVLQPTLGTGTAALRVAALAWLGHPAGA